MKALTNEIVKFPKSPFGRWIQCREGEIWITLTGDPNDYVLKSGDTFWCPPCSEALVQTLGRGKICSLDSRQPMTIRKSKPIAC